MLKRPIQFNYGGGDVAGDSGSSSLNAGINVITKIKAEFKSPKKDGTGEPVLIFTFVGENGGEVRETIWGVDTAKVKENNKNYPKKHLRDITTVLNGKEYTFKKDAVITDTEACVIAFNNFNRKVKHISTKIISEDTHNSIKGNDYASYCKALIKALGETNEGRWEIMVGYDKNGYLKLPVYPNFIRKEGDTSVKLDTSKVNLVRPEENKPSEVSEFDSPTSESSKTEEELF